jgi:pyruvate formate lyase activating enzyme
MTTRRDFVARLAAGGCALCAAGTGAVTSALPQDIAGGRPEALGDVTGLGVSPARWYKTLKDQWIECGLCPHGCKVPEGERGTCGVRENRHGTYYTLVHSRPCSLALDPIEKKPLFHFLPGASALSLATAGCNFECKCCQNWEIAQARPEQVPSKKVTPVDLVALARDKRAQVIACTYTEPVVWSEYVYDIAAAGKLAGLRTVMISNGYIREAPLDDLCQVLAAYKVDLKGFSDSFYRDHCHGELRPVLDTLRQLRRRQLWTEIVVLVIPTLNDGEAEIRDLARFVRDELGTAVPVHFTRFHPTYRLTNLPSTPVATLERARQVALEQGLSFVYLGNVPGHPGEHTYCPSCKRVLIRRLGLSLVENRLKAGACPDCHVKIPGVWS